MSSPSQASAPPKRRRLLRLLAWLAAAGLLLIIGAYVLLTSGAFIKGVVIPRVGRAMNAEVTVDAVSLHPFSQVVVRNLRVVPDGEDELLSLKEARLDYSLMRILRGHLEIESVLLDSPRLTVSQSADGHSNYDPLLQGSAPTNPEEAPSGTAPSLRLGKFEIRNATVVYRQETSADGSLTAEVTVPRFSLSNLANSETAQTELEAAIRFGSRQGATNHELAGTLTGSLTATLNPELEPTKVAGEVRYSTTTATGAFAEAAGLGARLKANITPDRFEELALDFARGDLALGRLTVSGPFSLQQLTGNLHCELGGIGPEVLSLLGGQYGIGFGRTQLAAAYDVRIADEARSVRASGTFRADQFGLVMGQVATPPLDLSLTEDIEVDLKSAALTLNRLNFEAKQNGEPRLTARLSQPLQVAWEKGVEGLEDSTFEVVLSNLDFKDWRALLGPEIEAGRLDGRLGLEVRNSGSEIGINLDSRLSRFTGVFGSARVQDFGATLAVLTTVTNQVAVFRETSLSLPPTALATNRITMTGSIDARDTDHIGGHLRLASDALDLTPQLAWFGEAPEATAPGGPEAGELPAPPEPLVLPFKDFVAEATIGHLLAGEISVTNLDTRILLDGGRVVLEPLTLVFNGAPARGAVRLDMTAPAWAYDIDLDARNVPLAPMVNTFQPERRGVVGGTISAVGQIQGAGFTGDDLRKSLQGKFDIGTTNLALKLVDVTNPLIRTIAGVATELPGLIRNPAGALQGLVGRLTGGESSGDPAWLNTLSQPPINVIALAGGAGDGRINLTTAALQTPAFRVGTHGTVTLASSLMDSTVSLPVEMSLSRSLAAKLGQLAANTPTNQAFVALPEFFSLGGTLEKPTRELKAIALAQMGAASAANLSGDSGGVAQQIGGALNVLQGLGGAGQAGAESAATNAAPSLGGLLEGIQKATGGQKPGNTNQSPLGGILNGILSPQSSGGTPTTNAAPAKR